MTKEEKLEIVDLVRDEVDKRIDRYHTDRIEKMESNLINEIKGVKADVNDVKKDITGVKVDTANLKGQMTWMTALLIAILGALLTGLAKYLMT